METILLIFIGLLIASFIIAIIGILLPRIRKKTKQCFLNAPIDKVYSVVTDNENWQYRKKTLDNLDIIEKKDSYEIWKEVSNNMTIYFKTLEKVPNSFYSFSMYCKVFSGIWQATFEPADGGTLFTATEIIEYKNCLYKMLGYAFMNLGKFMETYQEELREEVEK